MQLIRSVTVVSVHAVVKHTAIPLSVVMANHLKQSKEAAKTSTQNRAKKRNKTKKSLRQSLSDGPLIQSYAY